jgi:RNAse (barnase) inhibitor barstar
MDCFPVAIDLRKCLNSNYFVKRYMPELFRFPSYYGKNLDALNDCMLDLAWIAEKTVMIKFTNLRKASADNAHGVQEVLDMFHAWKAGHSRIHAKHFIFEGI